MGLEMAQISKKEVKYTKADIDQSLLNEALFSDRGLYTSPITLERTGEWSIHIPDPLVRTSAGEFKPASVTRVVSALGNVHLYRDSFIPIPDGSADVQNLLPDLAILPIPMDRKLDLLHFFGTSDKVLSPKVALRLVQKGVVDIAGKRRKTNVGFEHEQLCCSHPAAIDIEMDALGKKVEAVLIQLDYQRLNMSEEKSMALRSNLSRTRFGTGQKIDHLTEKEIMTYLLASKTQQVLAFIHPWFERVGRTSEEAMELITECAGVNFPRLSTPENRSTIEGYERGISLAVVAIRTLREVGRRMELTEDETSNIMTVKDLYRSVGRRKFPKVIYNSGFNKWYGHNVFPDETVMQKYFQTLHGVIMDTISTISLNGLTTDPDALYLTSHLISRGRYESERDVKK